MTASESASSLKKRPLLPLLVIGFGLVVFFLLFFADKTLLTNQKASTLATGGIKEGSVENVASQAQLPILAPDPVLEQQLAKLGSKEGPEKIRLLDTIVVSLQARNRFAYASDYAMQILDLDRSLPRQLLVGKLSQLASTLPYVQEDSLLRSQYEDRAVEHLQNVLNESPENEEALLALGLVMTRGKMPMQGILTLRKVTEINPQNWEAQYHLGIFSLQTQQWEKATARFETVLQIKPDHSDARYQLGLAYMQQNEAAKAIEQFEAVLADKHALAELKLNAKALLDKLKK